MKNVENIVYTVIIPHKNVPDLLLRCLSSIPDIEDIQVIVIDDKSDEEKVDFKNFPGKNRANTEVVFAKESKGAGYARNIGLHKAKGQWVLFADSDDFFNKSFLQSLNLYKNENDVDLIYFGLNSRFSDSLEFCKNRGKEINSKIQKAIEGDEESKNFIRYKILYPYSKMIKKEYIDKFNHKFDEVIASNDTMFGVKIGANTERIMYNSDEIYCATRRKDSLVTSYKYKNLKSRLLVSFDLYDYLKAIGKEQYAQSSFVHLLQIRRAGLSYFFKDFLLLFKHYSVKEIFKMIMKKISG